MGCTEIKSPSWMYGDVSNSWKKDAVADIEQPIDHEVLREPCRKKVISALEQFRVRSRAK
jgi:hypothetical protein